TWPTSRKSLGRRRWTRSISRRRRSARSRNTSGTRRAASTRRPTRKSGRDSRPGGKTRRRATMEVVAANRWARDLARYIRNHQPSREVSLRCRIKAITSGEGLDDNDIDQLERKVRWLIVGRSELRRIRRQHKEKRR